MQLSVVIPALNEAASILATLAPLQVMRSRGAEVILADGGSVDATRQIAAPFVDCIVDSAKGRARQMNAGAAVASGDALLFLHADSRLPEAADRRILEALDVRKPTWGRFDVAIAGSHPLLPVIAWFMNLRSRLTGIATGDQGIFMTRAAFERIGGFPDQPLMEDIEICKRLKKIDSPACLREKVVTSGRRWEKQGVGRTILLMWWLRLRYWMGASPAEIHRAYHGK
ncbi:MAG: TIGR04283 family arsenosugar biosynthesis glycosyltransferase [Betaproteobacteria bacterium]|nr:TIGR04283 family arsenosugar biosynthesis glycosyltransferase [Betaproteobacteria bacterium]